jgi:hypothetical protein
MLSLKVISHCRKNNWWYEDASETYSTALASLNISYESEAGYFFSHADDGPEFKSVNGRLYQVAWHALNTDYMSTRISINKALGLQTNLLTLDGFEGESGYFYDTALSRVLHLKLGTELLSYKKTGAALKQWTTFSSFLEFYFELSGRP